MLSKRPTQNWAKATPIRQKDEIISSDVMLNKERGFVPSYEKDDKEYLKLLMSDEYMRIWFKERAVYENTVYTKKQIQNEQANIRRRFVQHDWRRKTVVKLLPAIELKRFQDIPCKTDHGQFREKEDATQLKRTEELETIETA